MKNKWFLPVFVTLTLLSSHFANATLVRVSDGIEIADLAAESTTVWDINAAGKLAGAFNVLVGSTLYDVIFIDGSFDSIFGDAAGLDATTLGAAQAFSTALLNQVIVNNPYAVLDSLPALTNGCENVFICFIMSPYDVDQSSFAINQLLDAVDLEQPGSFERTFDTSTSIIETYADWALSSVRVSIVPEPTTGLLMLLGIAGLVVNRRKILRL